MSHPILENSPQVSFIQWNQEIQALTPNAPYQPFAECIRLGRSEWRFENAQAHCLHGRIERGRVNAVAVVDEKPIRFLSSDNLANLLKRPVRCGKSCDVDVSDPARAHLHDHKHVPHPKAGCCGHEESQARMPLAWLRTNVIQR